MNSLPKQNKHHFRVKQAYRRVLLMLVPHRDNNYQPHLIRRYGLLAVLMIIVAVQVFYNVSQTGSVLGEKANISQEALLSQTNQARKAADLDELKLNPKLNRAAYLKVSNMFDEQYWGHDAPDGTEPWHWLIEADYGYTKAGENLARNFYTAEAVTTAWMGSKDHRKNILEPDYTEAGFAVMSGELNGEQSTIVVALYGRPLGTGAVVPGILMSSSEGGSPDILTRIGIGMQSVTPAALGSIILLTLVMMIAFAAHLYRDLIPPSPHHPRHRRSHGAIKMSLMFGLILAMLALYGGGQI